jgi:hypothetical protein
MRNDKDLAGWLFRRKLMAPESVFETNVPLALLTFENSSARKIRITTAHTNGFLQHEAVCNEPSSLFDIVTLYSA